MRKAFALLALVVFMGACSSKEDPVEPYLNISPKEKSVDYYQDVLFVDVSSNTGWTVSSDASWATVPEGRTQSDGKFKVNVSSNSTESSRVCSIEVRSDKGLTACFKLTQLPHGQSILDKPMAYVNPAGNDFPIMAWFSIYGNYLTQEKFKEMEDAGFNLSYSHLGILGDTGKALNAAKGTKVKIIASCDSYGGTDERKILELVKAYKNHPQLAGYHLKDEPVMSQFGVLSQLVRSVRKEDNDHFIYINLLPNYAGTQVLGGTYTEYLTTYLAQVGLAYLSFDHYPITVNGLRTDFYSNLEVVREVTEKEDIPFWAFALSTAHGNFYPVATYESLAFQIYNNLAYGAQGIEYFTYMRPGEGNPAELSYWTNAGLLDYSGVRSPVYDCAKKINAEVKALTKVFLGAKIIDVSHTKDQEGNLPNHRTHELSEMPTNVSALSSNGTGVVVSHLRNGANEYMLVVNRDYKASQKVNISFTSDVVRITGDGKESPVSASSVSYDITAGNMLLFRLK